ncbi:unnamed protein product [Tenebrio molitor]|nr:unnamed protein product [Tenebrio molitor]
MTICNARFEKFITVMDPSDTLFASCKLVSLIANRVQVIHRIVYEYRYRIYYHIPTF